MTVADNLTVIVAFEQAGANLPAILESLAPDLHPRTQILLCRTPVDAHLSMNGAAPNVRWLECNAGSRIPEMWRDGILAARGDFVALLTAHCVPDRAWLDRVERLEFGSDVAGIGGHFLNDSRASPVDRAIYLLRYSAFSQPTASEDAKEIAADNAVYHRSAVLACHDLLPSGFWEPEYHRVFAARGLRLRLVPDMPVIHTNRYSAAQFAGQRRDHGRQYGRDRAQRLTTARKIIYLAAIAVVPFLLLTRVLGRAYRDGQLNAVRGTACLWLLYFCTHWALGEAKGVLDDLMGKTRP